MFATSFAVYRLANEGIYLSPELIVQAPEYFGR